MRTDRDTLADWHKKCLAAAATIPQDEPLPLTTAQVDQLLAAGSEAGLSEREQGVMVMSLVAAAMNRQPKWRRWSRSKSSAMTAAITIRLLK